MRGLYFSAMKYSNKLELSKLKYRIFVESATTVGENDSNGSKQQETSHSMEMPTSMDRHVSMYIWGGCIVAVIIVFTAVVIARKRIKGRPIHALNNIDLLYKILRYRLENKIYF